MSLDQCEDCKLLESAIKRALGENVQEISVKVEGNKVYLYGSVYSPQQRAKLEMLARSVPGVAAVENYLCVNLFI